MQPNVTSTKCFKLNKIFLLQQKLKNLKLYLLNVCALLFFYNKKKAFLEEV